jgi:hypothetical protein
MRFVLKVGGTPEAGADTYHRTVLTVFGLGRTGSVITPSRIQIIRTHQAHGHAFDICTIACDPSKRATIKAWCRINNSTIQFLMDVPDFGRASLRRR